MDGWYSVRQQATHREIRLSAPAGWAFTEVPPDWSVKSLAGAGSMRYFIEGGALRAEIDLRITGNVVDRQAYHELRDLLHAAAVAEHRPVMIRQNIAHS